MTLRVKNGLIIGAIFFILFILGYIIPSRIILNEYLKSEKRFINNNIDRFNVIYNQEIENLDKILNDWAYWDDTYQFIKDKNEEYIKSNLVNETFENLKINFMIFFDKNWNVVFKKYYNLTLNKEEDFPEDLLNILNNKVTIFNIERLKNIKGILSIDSQVFIFSVRGITTSDLKAPINGYAAIGYILTPEKLWDLSKILGYPVILFPYDYKYLPEDFKIAKENLRNNDVYIKPITDFNISSYFFIKDIFNNKSAILRIDFERDIYSQGKTTLNYFLILFLTVGVVLTTVFIVILRRTILNPLTDTINIMNKIADRLDFKERLKIKGKDEISKFRESFNNILEKFSIYEEKIKESEEKYRSLFENAVEGIFQSTPDGRIINANNSFVKMLGYDSLEEMKKLDIKKDLYYNPEDRDAFLNEINEKGFFSNRELTLKKKDGSKIVVLENSRAVKDKDGNIVFYEGMFTDITKIKEYEERLSFRIKLEKLISEVALSFISVDSSKLEKSIIENFKKLGELLQFDRIYLSLFLENSIKITKFYEWDREGVESIKNKVMNLSIDESNIYLNKIKKFENIFISCQDKINKHVFFDYSIYMLILMPLVYGSSLKGFIGFETVEVKKLQYDEFIKLFLQIFGDILINTIERIRNENNLKYLSFHDQLTGLYNRFYFEEELERLSKSRDLSLSIILCDIDNLKFINDAFGHYAGDVAIVEVSKILKRIFRESDIIARIGGDEFVILLQSIDEDTIKNIIKRIYEEVLKYSSNVGSLPINLSIGYAILKDKVENPYEVFKEADDMMYSVKISKKDLDKDILIDKLKNDLIVRGGIDKDLIDNMKNIAIDFSNYLSLSEESKEKLINLIEYHDIGLVNLYEKALAPLELSLSLDYKRHPHIGYRIVINSKRLSKIGELILKHHEEWNGEGYPLRLKGEEIPIEDRIFSIIYEYCKNMDLDEIKKNSGIKFDPILSQKFIEFINIKFKHEEI